MSELIRFADYKRPGRHVFFDRSELNQLLSLYSRRVARGEWRDYAIDLKPGMAVFSVFRHSQERPLYAVVKRAAAPDRAPDYLILNGRQKLKSGATLAELLDVFELRLQVVS